MLPEGFSEHSWQRRVVTTNPGNSTCRSGWLLKRELHSENRWHNRIYLLSWDGVRKGTRSRSSIQEIWLSLQQGGTWYAGVSRWKQLKLKRGVTGLCWQLAEIRSGQLRLSLWWWTYYESKTYMQWQASQHLSVAPLLFNRHKISYCRALIFKVLENITKYSKRLNF